jgi:hypothetical protein
MRHTDHLSTCQVNSKQLQCCYVLCIAAASSASSSAAAAAAAQNQAPGYSSSCCHTTLTSPCLLYSKPTTRPPLPQLLLLTGSIDQAALLLLLQPHSHAAIPMSNYSVSPKTLTSFSGWQLRRGGRTCCCSLLPSQRNTAAGCSAAADKHDMHATPEPLCITSTQPCILTLVSLNLQRLNAL